MSNRTVEQGKVVKFTVNGSEHRGVVMSIKQYGESTPKATVACFDGTTCKVAVTDLQPSRLPNGINMGNVLVVANLDVAEGDEVMYKGEKCTVLGLHPFKGKVTLSAPWDVKRPYAGVRERTSKSTTTVYADRVTKAK